jgi:integrase
LAFLHDGLKITDAQAAIYRGYDRRSSGRPEALNDRSPRPDRVWNRIPDSVRETSSSWRLLAVARKLFNWVVGRDLLAASPCDRFKAAELHGPPAARDRVLADDELRAVWRAAEAMPYPYGQLVRMLILTGQRRDEIAGAAWGELTSMPGC